MSNAAQAAAAVELTVDPGQLLVTLRHAFSNSTTLFPELMQNARRAGATRVAFEVQSSGETTCRVVVTDDGRGIDDLSVLLRLGASAWPEQIMEAEAPYGMGFLASLFAAKHITVESRGQSLSAETSHILARRPIVITACASEDGQTRIVLDGIEIPAERILAVLTSNAKGFPIPVSVNDTWLDRPHADTEAHAATFAETPIGRVRIPGIHCKADIRDPNEQTLYSPHLYLLGLPVSTERGRGVGDCQVHLDPQHFNARWPDRESLNNAMDAQRDISAALKAVVYQFLREERTRRGDEAFIDRYLDAWGQCFPDLFTDVCFVHRLLLDTVPQYPQKRPTYFDGIQRMPPAASVTREQVEIGAVTLINLESEFDPEDNANAWMAVHAARANTVLGVTNTALLPAWARGHVRSAEDIEMKLHGEDETPRVFHGAWLSHRQVKFCTHYTLRLTGADAPLVDIADEALCYRDPLSDADTVIIVPAGESSGEVTHQACAFESDDHYYEEEAEEEADMFSRFLLAERGNPDVVLRQILQFGEVAAIDKLRAKRFIVEIAADGKVAVETIDAAPRRPVTEAV